MRLITKIVLLLLVIGLSLPFWLKGPSGQPLITPADLARVSDKLVQMAESAGRRLDSLSLPEVPDLPGPGSSEPLEYYRWQDEEGVWHFSDTPPPGVSAEPVAEQLPGVANSMQAPPSTEPPPVATGTGPAMDSSITPPLPEGVSQEAIEQVIQDAHERRMGEQL